MKKFVAYLVYVAVFIVSATLITWIGEYLGNPMQSGFAYLAKMSFALLGAALAGARLQKLSILGIFAVVLILEILIYAVMVYIVRDISLPSAMPYSWWQATQIILPQALGGLFGVPILAAAFVWMSNHLNRPNSNLAPA